MLTTPAPPTELIQLVTGENNTKQFLLSRRPAVEEILRFLSEANVDIHKCKHILDWGCGCGRILAGWEGLLERDVHLVGVDVNPQLIEFCKNSIKYADAQVCGYMPPLNFSTGYFDIIYGASVYTHLTVSAMKAWTRELVRLLRLGGVLILSFHGSYYLDTLKDLDPEGPRMLKENGYYLYVHPNACLGSNDYAAFHTVDFLKALFKDLSLLKAYSGVTPSSFAAHQDILVLRRSGFTIQYLSILLNHFLNECFRRHPTRLSSDTSGTCGLDSIR
jgi:SAM-dependent methyltransferase